VVLPLSRTQDAGLREQCAHNVFEAVTAYAAAPAKDGQDRIAEATNWASSEALSSG
jgi:hypothetical protein